MKILIIRLSSLGDIVQAAPAAKALKARYKKAQIHWLVRKDFLHLAEGNPSVDQIWSLERNTGTPALWRLFQLLKREQFTHIYDAHNNLRSNLLLFFFRYFAKPFSNSPKIIQRSKNRWRRFLFFKLRKPVFTIPFRGSHSFLEPLQAWAVPTSMPTTPNLSFPPTSQKNLPSSFITLAPSAAWPNKRWPQSHWEELIPKLHTYHIIVLGGPEDHFCQKLVDIAPERVINLAGKTTIQESCSLVQASALTISADTGLLHVADQTGTKNIGLIGPTAFGYTSQPQSKILEVQLDCKPCSKDGRNKCTNATYQKCMVDITPESVAHLAKTMLEQN